MADFVAAACMGASFNHQTLRLVADRDPDAVQGLPNGQKLAVESTPAGFGGAEMS